MTTKTEKLAQARCIIANDSMYRLNSEQFIRALHLPFGHYTYHLGTESMIWAVNLMEPEVGTTCLTTTSWLLALYFPASLSVL